MTSPAFETLLARVHAALKAADLTRKRQVSEVVPMGNVVIVIKAPRSTRDRIHWALGRAQIRAVRDGLTLRVPLHLNTGFKLTFVEAGNEETVELGSFEDAKAVLTSRKANEARLEWKDVRGPQRRSYRFENGGWQFDVSAADLHIDGETRLSPGAFDRRRGMSTTTNDKVAVTVHARTKRDLKKRIALLEGVTLATLKAGHPAGLFVSFGHHVSRDAAEYPHHAFTHLAP